MAKLCFSPRGFFIVEGTILVVGFTASSDLALKASYKFADLNVCLNAPEYPLH